MLNNLDADLTRLNGVGQDAGREEQPMADAECRVCRGGVEAGMLYYPCRCKGSIRYVHEDCLMEWLSYSNKTSCEVCNAEFHFRPIYRGGMPQTLGRKEVFFGSVELLLSQAPLVLRYLSVSIIWLLVLPYLVQRIHTLFYATTLPQIYHILHQTLTTLFTHPIHAFSACMQGFFLELLIVLTFLGIMTLQEKVNRQERIHRHLFRPRQPLPDQQHQQNNQNAHAHAHEQVQEEEIDQRHPFRGIEIEQMPEMLNNFQNDGRVDVLLGLGDGGILKGMSNMLFVTLANGAFLLCFQLLPFTLGRAIARVLPPVNLNTTDPLVCTLIGYVTGVACVGVYLIATYLFRLQNKQHIRYLKQWSFHVSDSILGVGKLLVISCVEYVLLAPVIGVVAHAASLGVFRDSQAKNRINTCMDTPNVCIGIHWLVGTLLTFVVTILVQSLRKVVRHKWMDLLSDWVLGKRRVRLADAREQKADEAPYPPGQDEYGDHVDAPLVVRDVVLSKSFGECFSYTASVILFSMPLAALLLYLPIRILNEFTSIFPLVLEDVKVDVDIFLMHTAVPYILDSVELAPVFTTFLHLLVVGLAFPLDLHGLLMAWKNVFSFDTESEFIRVKEGATVCRDSVPNTSMGEVRCEGFQTIVQQPTNSRADLTCMVCGLMPWTSLRKVFQECEQGMDPYFSSINPIPVFAVADGYGYALPVFLSSSSLKEGTHRAIARALFTAENEQVPAMEVHEPVEIEHQIRSAIDAFIVELGLFKGREYALRMQEQVSMDAPAINLLREFLFCLSRAESRALLAKMPEGFGERLSQPSQNVVMTRRIARLFSENGKHNVFLLSFKNAVVSSCRGRSLVLDRNTQICIQPVDRCEPTKEVEQKWLEMRFKERYAIQEVLGQFWILQYHPGHIKTRLFVFFVASVICAVVLLSFVIYIPLVLGRSAFTLCMIPLEHDLYHWTVGCIMVWGTLRMVLWGFRRIVKDGSVLSMLRGCIKWIQTMISNLACVFVMFIVIPVTCGVLFELSVLHPIYYPVDRTPIVSTFGNWAGGLFLIKGWSRLVEIGIFGETEWVRKVESLQNIRGIDQIWLLREVAAPVLAQLCLRLSLPYFVAKIVGACFCDEYGAESVLRYIFPVFAIGFLLYDTINVLFIWLNELHDRIRDQRYLVGRRLENFMQHRFNVPS